MDFRLYLITDASLFDREDALLNAVEGALKAGVKALQLREKSLPVRRLLALAYRMREMTARYQAKLFINDRTDIALLAGADGVHLGQMGMPPFAVRKIAGEKLLVGVSTHSAEEARIAELEGADFITFGPLYATPSKLRYGAPVGLDALCAVVKDSTVPVFGIGGIKTDNVRDVIEAGADGIAVISGILGGNDSAGAAEKYLRLLGDRL